MNSSEIRIASVANATPLKPRNCSRPGQPLDSATLLSEWTVECRNEERFRCFSYAFSPSGRLFIEMGSQNSLRVTNLLTAAILSLECPKEIAGFQFLPLTENRGVFIGDGKFLRAELDLKNRRVLVDLKRPELIPKDGNGRRVGDNFTRLDDRMFGYTLAKGDGSDCIRIRRLNAEIEEEKWIRIENKDFHSGNNPKALCQHNGNLFVYTNAEKNPLLCYSLSRKTWKVLNVGSIEGCKNSEMGLQCLNGLLISHRGNDHIKRKNLWNFCLIDPITRESIEYSAKYPRECSWPNVYARGAVTESGIVGVLVRFNHEKQQHSYEAHLIEMKDQLKLERSGRKSLDSEKIDPRTNKTDRISKKSDSEDKENSEAKTKENKKGKEAQKPKLASQAANWVLKRPFLKSKLSQDDSTKENAIVTVALQSSENSALTEELAEPESLEELSDVELEESESESYEDEAEALGSDAIGEEDEEAESGSQSDATALETDFHETANQPHVFGNGLRSLESSEKTRPQPKSRAKIQKPKKSQIHLDEISKHNALTIQALEIFRKAAESKIPAELVVGAEYAECRISQNSHKTEENTSSPAVFGFFSKLFCTASKNS